MPASDKEKRRMVIPLSPLVFPILHLFWYQYSTWTQSSHTYKGIANELYKFHRSFIMGCFTHF
jgi:hypothetical protein